MQDLVLPCALIAEFAVLGFDILRPVAATRIEDVDTLGLAAIHAFQ